MAEAIQMHIGGIRCDNPECNFEDMSVRFENYDQWLNKPCLECGQNLLTDADFSAIKRLIHSLTLLIEKLPPISLNEQKAKMQLEMNGTGNVNVKTVEI